MSQTGLILGERSPARIYVTSPTFGIDLSVPWLNARFERRYEELDLYAGTPLAIRGSIPTSLSFHLNIEFGLNERGLLLYCQDRPCQDRPYSHRKTFLLDEKIPPLPERPIWLPPGCWECAYCSTTQNADLLQCRSCGAPRIGKDA